LLRQIAPGKTRDAAWHNLMRNPQGRAATKRQQALVEIVGANRAAARPVYRTIE